MPHYFDTPDGVEHRREIKARFWDTDWTFVSADGVFAADRLDIGTSVLLRTCSPPSGPARILDLGCGYGPIAVGLAVASPLLQVDAVDVNERALALCAENAKRYGVADRVHVYNANDYLASQSSAATGQNTAAAQDIDTGQGTATTQDAVGVRYDAIFSNPPIRIGKAALQTLLLTWLPRLTPEGTARLVVGKNLGADSLQRWLISQGWSCERIASAKGFRVFAVRSSDL